MTSAGREVVGSASRNLAASSGRLEKVDCCFGLRRDERAADLLLRYFAIVRKAGYWSTSEGASGAPTERLPPAESNTKFLPTAEQLLHYSISNSAL